MPDQRSIDDFAQSSRPEYLKDVQDQFSSWFAAEGSAKEKAEEEYRAECQMLEDKWLHAARIATDKDTRDESDEENVLQHIFAFQTFKRNHDKFIRERQQHHEGIADQKLKSLIESLQAIRNMQPSSVDLTPLATTQDPGTVDRPVMPQTSLDDNNRESRPTLSDEMGHLHKVARSEHETRDHPTSRNEKDDTLLSSSSQLKRKAISTASELGSNKRARNAPKPLPIGIKQISYEEVRRNLQAGLKYGIREWKGKWWVLECAEHNLRFFGEDPLREASGHLNSSLHQEPNSFDRTTERLGIQITGCDKDRAVMHNKAVGEAIDAGRNARRSTTSSENDDDYLDVSAGNPTDNATNNTRSRRGRTEGICDPTSGEVYAVWAGHVWIPGLVLPNKDFDHPVLSSLLTGSGLLAKLPGCCFHDPGSGFFKYHEDFEITGPSKWEREFPVMVFRVDDPKDYSYRWIRAQDLRVCETYPEIAVRREAILKLLHQTRPSVPAGHTDQGQNREASVQPTNSAGEGLRRGGSSESLPSELPQTSNLPGLDTPTGATIDSSQVFTIIEDSESDSDATNSNDNYLKTMYEVQDCLRQASAQPDQKIAVEPLSCLKNSGLKGTHGSEASSEIRPPIAACRHTGEHADTSKFGYDTCTQKRPPESIISPLTESFFNGETDRRSKPPSIEAAALSSPGLSKEPKALRTPSTCPGRRLFQTQRTDPQKQERRGKSIANVFPMAAQYRRRTLGTSASTLSKTSTTELQRAMTSGNQDSFTACNTTSGTAPQPAWPEVKTFQAINGDRESRASSPEAAQSTGTRLSQTAESPHLGYVSYSQEPNQQQASFSRLSSPLRKTVEPNDAEVHIAKKRPPHEPTSTALPPLPTFQGPTQRGAKQADRSSQSAKTLPRKSHTSQNSRGFGLYAGEEDIWNPI